MLTYNKLWILLEKKGMKRTDLKAVISGATLAKLGKNEPINSTVIEKICDFLKCQPGDIMENITKEDIETAGKIVNEKIAEVMSLLQATTGMSKEAILDEFMKEAPGFIKELQSDDFDILNLKNPPLE